MLLKMMLGSVLAEYLKLPTWSLKYTRESICNSTQIYRLVVNQVIKPLAKEL